MSDDAGFVRGPPDWRPQRGEGVGSFTSRVTWLMPKGGEARWESRSARERGAIAVKPAAGETTTTLRAPAALARRLRRVNWVAAGAPAGGAISRGLHPKRVMRSFGGDARLPPSGWPK